MDPAYVSEGPDRQGDFEHGPGVKLHYELFIPDGPVKGRLIVLWGAVATSQHFLQEADLLKAHGYEVLLFDHRGVCRSGPCVLELQSAVMLARDALDLLDHVWPGEAVHVFGASMGGMVAQELGVLLLQCTPQPRLASLMLCVTARGRPRGQLYARMGWVLPALLRPLMAWRNGSDKRAIVQRTMDVVFTKEYLALQHPCGQTYREVHARVWEDNFDQLWTFTDHTTTACHIAVVLTHWLTDAKLALLRDSGVRITVQVSSQDALVAPELQHALAKGLHAHEVTFPIGHMGAFQYADRYHAMLLDHLAAASTSIPPGKDAAAAEAATAAVAAAPVGATPKL